MSRALGGAILALGIAWTASAQRAPELFVAAPPELAGLAARLEALDRSRLATATAFAGLDDPGPPIRVVLAREGTAEARRAPSWAAGYATGAAGPVVLLADRSPAYPDDSLEELLHHEVAHVLIARALRGRTVPRWFDEGVATAAGGAWTWEDGSRFALEALRRGRTPLADLDPLFHGGGGEAARAYAVSGAFVRDLVLRSGPGVTGEVLRRVGAGEEFSAAFRAATGVSLPAAEAEFWRREGRGRWIPFVTSSAALWLVAMALAVAAFRRRRRRAAELARRWEEEEAAGSPRRPPF